MTPDSELRGPSFPFQIGAVLEGLPDAFQAFDRQWRYAYLNRRAERMLGRPREELLGKVCWEEYPGAVGTPFYQNYQEAMESRKTLIFEEFCPHENTWVEFTLYPVADGLAAFTRDVTDRKRAEEALRRSETHYRALFDQVLDAVVVADDAGALVDANPAACQMLGAPCDRLLGTGIPDFTPGGAADGGHAGDAWRELLRVGEQAGEFVLRRPDGALRTLEYRAKAGVLPGLHMSVFRDVTDRKSAEERTARLLRDLTEERETLDTVNRIGRLLSAELNLDRLVQAATDAATGLTGAQFGAFFYNVTNAEGESFVLYTISGVPREAFSRFPMPRATHLFGPTFRGEGTIRVGDVTADPRYGQMPPHHGMPAGHLPVKSYLAVPVISRSGEALGGLFFGHEEPNLFTERSEKNVQALAAQLAVAMDNARLFGDALRANEQARREIEERARVERRLAQSEAHQRGFLRDVLASVTEGRLRLCDGPDDLPPRLPAFGGPVALSEQTLHVLRRQAMRAAQAVGLDKDRSNDLITAANEAGMNAVVHAGSSGTATVGMDAGAGVVQVRVEDRGGGIEMSRLPRATLDRGYTTAGTLGHGFKMVLASVDAVWLLTGPTGTTVVLAQGREAAPEPGWLARTAA